MLCHCLYNYLWSSVFYLHFDHSIKMIGIRRGLLISYQLGILVDFLCITLYLNYHVFVWYIGIKHATKCIISLLRYSYGVDILFFHQSYNRRWLSLQSCWYNYPWVILHNFLNNQYHEHSQPLETENMGDWFT